MTIRQRLTSVLPSYSRCAHFLKQQATLTFSILIATTVWSTGALAQADPLASWNDTATKKAIIAFVEKVTKEGSSDFVKPEERIATFDNDGTLWVEQPN